MSPQTFRRLTSLSTAVLLCSAAAVIAQQPGDLGFKDTPILPGQKWHVHDSDRPHANVVTPGATPGAPPSDAIVLFDGKDLSKWQQRGQGGKLTPPKWKVADGYFEIVPNNGDLVTRDKFGDCQLHIEWSEPTDIRGTSQDRGNSGVYLMSRYEIQILDALNNPTYADGAAGSVYGQWPPLVNPGRKAGEWNVYDIAFEAPRFEGGKVVKPAYQTVFFNGVLAHNHKEVLGTSIWRKVATYTPHAAEEPLLLQDHHHPVRFRNIWIRRVLGYDQPEKK